MENFKIDKNNVQNIYELTPMQESMLLYYMKNPESEMYFEQLHLEFFHNVDFKIFFETWKNIINQNEILKSVRRFENIKKPVQIILKNIDFNSVIFYEDCTDKNIATVLEEDRNKKFDLRNISFRVKLCKFDNNRYVVIISNHHILYDGWSTGILLKEFVTDYDKVSKNLSLNFSSKISYKEFVKIVNNQDKAEIVSYWKPYLENVTQFTEIPFIKNFKKNESSIGETYLKIDSNKISHFLKENKITVANLIYCIWGLLLWQYNNCGNIMFGTTVSGREANINKIENTVGLFINTVPLKISPNPNDKIADFLNDIKNDLNIRKTYENTSLSEIKKCIDIKFENEMFSSIVVIENYPLDIKMLTKNSTIPISNYGTYQFNNFDLTLGVSVFEDYLDICLSYNKLVLSEFDVKRIKKHFENILCYVINNSQNFVSDIEIVDTEEQNKLICNFNNIKDENIYDVQNSIKNIFEKQVLKTPSSPAVVYDKNALTYAELNEKAEKLSLLLKKKNIKNNDIVGIMAERSFDLIVALIAVIKSGAAFLLIDPEYPLARKKYMFENSAAKILLTQEKLLKKSKGISNSVLDINTDEVVDKNIDNTSVSLGDLLYVVYTSGTTGNPKGVMITNGNLIFYLESYLKLFNLSSQDASIHLVPISFDLFIEEIFIVLLTGGKFVIPNSEEFLDMWKLHDLINDNKVSIVSCSPVLLNAFNGLPKMESVHTFINGGDTLKWNQIDQLITYADVYNGYGPAEATIGATFHKLKDYEKNISIGKPLDGYRVYILSKAMKLQPIGVVGELYVAGEGIAKGYINNLETTDQKFLEDIFFENRRMYKTGDMAKWNEDGTISFLGREDFQVKVRGLRVELGEIENQLKKYKGIQETVVLLHEKSENNKYLCAYLVTNETFDNKNLKQFLLELLPEFMIPKKIIKISEIPYTSSGKIDKNKLLDIANNDNEDINNKEKILPQDDTEKFVLSVWQEVLEIKNISMDDDFFDIGGDSLSLIKVSSLFNKKYEKLLSMQNLFDYRTAISLANLIKEKTGISNSSDENYTSIEF